ncbi:KH domain-containing, RNA-binding, signal transduction-associated protein 2-like isoform X4 [Galleria mellonella]|uniref:KH domain-containing, RNA-binding, signal transduction-associated protein 2-like isoform X4 n=1 Tax=Galleria mellonella TaxID=7137 RepID=A0ABM3MY12_GALME|nr:KH domain-containing, RNA-binding, signal transduction-associated protein 2-like isoform X4 [Galleria mellonella]
MADAKFDKNGYNSGDFKRNPNSGSQNDLDQDGEDGSKLNEKAGEYMRELLSEKIKLHTQKFPLSIKLIDQEVTRVQTSGRAPVKDFKYVDVYNEKPVKVTVKVLVPVKEHPKFNFVGKLLGPKGNTMKQMQDETMCKMAVLGRGSMRDRQKEEELRNSLDPKYSHLSDELHVEISALAPPAEAHARIAYALAEVKKHLSPDTNDMIRQNQMRDIMDRGPRPGPAGPHGRPPRMQPPPPLARPMPAKNKVISILDRARSAMESNYSYDDPYGPAEPPVRGPGPRAAPEPDFYYERSHERYYEDDPYYKDDSREFKTSARDVGTRRPGPQHPQHPQQPRHYARASPYARPPKTATKKRSQ